MKQAIAAGYRILVTCPATPDERKQGSQVKDCVLAVRLVVAVGIHYAHLKSSREGAVAQHSQSSNGSVAEHNRCNELRRSRRVGATELFERSSPSYQTPV